MRAFAYCAVSFKESARRAAGVEPLTCPPASAESFDPLWLEGLDFLYFDLHGNPGEAFWRGDDRIVALTATQILRADLGGAIVFATNCYLADQDSPMMNALLEAGAQYVIGGEGQNWAGQRTVYGASLLGQRFRRLLERGLDPLKAVTLAKRWVQLGLVANRILGRRRMIQTVEDTLAFRVYYRRDMDGQDRFLV